jgi:histidinol-phosphatase (PHP family)
LGDLADYHIHSRFSPDSRAEIGDICEAAIARGLSEIAVTDHVDFGPADGTGVFQPVEYLAEIEHCRARYGDRLTIRAGLEIGEPHLFPEQVGAVMAAGAFDLVIGSAHYADGMQPAWRAAYFDQPVRAACENYFRQVLRLAAGGDWDVLGHLDLVKRDARKYGLVYDGPAPYAETIRAALRHVVERGKGIEINTSPLHRGQTEPCPSLEILRWYRELGGEILTFGSDAHTPDAVAAYFDVARDMALAAGFTRRARFAGRKVDWVDL